MSDLPRDNLFRSAPAFELRALDRGDGDDDDVGGGMPTMVVNFARFNEWTEINSLWEGRFLERFAPGAFRKTFREQAGQIRAIFQHGRDPQIGLKPLGTVEDLWEDDDGAWGEVGLFDADYVRELLPGLDAEVFGASFAFQVIRSEDVMDPGRSDHNPDGIPERTVKEARLREFGPVTWGAYPSATAAVRSRSLTDEFIGERDPQRLRELADRIEAAQAAQTARQSGETSSDPDQERAPASEATPALTLARHRLLLMERRLPAHLRQGRA
ncbi:MAG: HK97 family phage prohead protease [Steroidobacteraceae bacterium]|nr:HK97 family phage prohead protease [Steroidobacteraceae bacterium]